MSAFSQGPADPRAALVELGNQLLDDGLVVRTWGNFSARTGPETLLMSPTGRAYPTMQECDLAELMPDGTWTGPYKPSGEHHMHEIALRLRPDLDCVVHTHQSYASALSLGAQDYELTPDQADALGQQVLPISSYGLPGTKKLHKNVEHTLETTGANVVLLESHGTIIIAQDPDDARRLGNALEQVSAEIYDRLVPGGRAPVLTSKRVASSRRIGGELHYFDAEDAPVVPDAVSRKRHERCYSERKDVNAVVSCEDPDVATFYGRTLRPYLDDFAQLVGTRATRSSRHNVVLLKDEALCLGPDPVEAGYVKHVLVKNARSARVAVNSGGHPIVAWECLLMNVVYKLKYSKEASR